MQIVKDSNKNNKESRRKAFYYNHIKGISAQELHGLGQNDIANLRMLQNGKFYPTLGEGINKDKK
jgi:hypothetical protein